MRKIKPAAWFLLFWLFVCSYTGIWKYFNHPPDGIHQGAQTDRACIAWNYYDKSMNFFKPRVMETRANDGVVGMEFPIVNYSVALLYKVFGPHDIIYRILVFIIVTIGLYAAWLISGFFIRRVLNRLVLVLSWFLSPIFIFYSFNFVPDPVSMAFSMLALYFFFRVWFQIDVKRSIWFYLLFISLAGLIKVTFLIFHIAVFIILFFDKIAPGFLPGNARPIRNRILYFFVPIIPVIAWYYWANLLTYQTGNTHFMQHINPATSLSEVWEFTRYSFDTWDNSIYLSYEIYVIIGLFLIAFFTRKKDAPLLSAFSFLCLLGFLSVFLLFQFQFKFHDYYFIILYPVIFFMLLFMQQVFLEGKFYFSGIFPVLFVIAFYVMPFYHLGHASHMISERYKTDSYYYQAAIPAYGEYYRINEVIDSLVPKNKELVSAFDPTPNTSLYFLRRCGLRIATDFTPEFAAGLMNDRKLDYLVINDSAKWESQFQPKILCNKRLLYKKGIISVWKLDE